MSETMMNELANIIASNPNAKDFAEGWKEGRKADKEAEHEQQ